ncbi:MAG: hypothetical protein QM487_12855, partial [Candidatus Marithrix sp.]
MLVRTLDIPDLDWLDELKQQDVPEVLQNVVFACLNKSRQGRPSDAGKLLEMLRPDRFPKPVRSEVESSRSQRPVGNAVRDAPRPATQSVA